MCLTYLTYLEMSTTTLFDFTTPPSSFSNSQFMHPISSDDEPVLESEQVSEIKEHLIFTMFRGAIGVSEIPDIQKKTGSSYKHDESYVLVFVTVVIKDSEI